MKFVVVGGGSAGWMSAATLVSQISGAEITVIEPSNSPTIGVGESTINDFVDWLNLLKISPEGIMKDTDAIFKLAIHFKNFYSENDEGLFYPFGGWGKTMNDLPNSELAALWNKRRIFHNESCRNWADSFYANMALIRNKTFTSRTELFDGKHFALHFDAIKFANCLKTNYCLPRGVKVVEGEVAYVNTNSEGVSSVILKDGVEVRGDFFLDCTGFKSILLGGAMGEPFVPYEGLPNNKAWATQIPYVSKETELEPFTDCTALGNGWVWNIPLWSRIGTGYVFSDEFVTEDEALAEFKEYLGRKGRDPEQFQYKLIKFRTGIHKRTWVKNVVGIGLAAGFIEPLESSGLWTIHTNLIELSRILTRGSWNAWDISNFNWNIEKLFIQFAQFVHIHYTLSTRRDTAYWRKVASQEEPVMEELRMARLNTVKWNYTTGINCILNGMKYWLFDDVRMRSHIPYYCNIKEEAFSILDENWKVWDEASRRAPPLLEILRSIHDPYVHQVVEI